MQTLKTKIVELETKLLNNQSETEKILITLEKELQKKESQISILQKHGLEKGTEFQTKEKMHKSQKSDLVGELDQLTKENDSLKDKIKKQDAVLSKLKISHSAQTDQLQHEHENQLQIKAKESSTLLKKLENKSAFI